MLADGAPAEVRSINKVGMERAGFSSKDIETARGVFKVLYKSDLNRSQAIDYPSERLHQGNESVSRKSSSSLSQANGVWPNKGEFSISICFCGDFRKVVPREDAGRMTVAELYADGILSHVSESIDFHFREISVGVASETTPKRSASPVCSALGECRRKKEGSK